VSDLRDRLLAAIGNPASGQDLQNAEPGCNGVTALKSFRNPGVTGRADVTPRLSNEFNAVAPLHLASVNPTDQTKLAPCHSVLAVLCERCPDYVEVADWQRAIEDGRSFLEQWGEQAKALGWTTRDLFGLQPVPDKPALSYRRLTRYDETGLCWLLRGRQVVALSEALAVVKTATGAVTVYRRLHKPALGPLGDSLNDLDDGSWQ
jgi:hypothetical protein